MTAFLTYLKTWLRFRALCRMVRAAGMGGNTSSFASDPG